ncbi:MAG: DUF4321 domain-containing protein [Lachnospiraceae bacterium]|nr:DUF4321 domain-containing protein [Lachnospiraceae bacterium]
MKRKNNWTCFLLILAGLVVGGLIGNVFPADSWINYGQTFGLSSPVVLDLGIICLTFGMSIKITVASLIGIVIGIVVYRFL